MVLPPEKIKQSIFSVISPERVSAIYQVGMVDDSPLSDTDVVIVLKEVVSTLDRKKLASLSEEEIDVHGVFSEQEFLQEMQFLDTAELRVVFGEVPQVWNSLREDPERSLVKLSSLFLTSFLRNFYELSARPYSTERILKHLNDFEYVKAYIPEMLTENGKSLLARIRAARMRTDEISLDDAQKILREGIDEAWIIIARLDERLKSVFQQQNVPTLFLGREPTVFVPFTAGECRRKTDLFLKNFERTKILVVPIGFQFLYNDDSFVTGYVARHLAWHSTGIVPSVKHLLKTVYALYVHWRVRANFKQI